jgi:hypothetical protein
MSDLDIGHAPRWPDAKAIIKLDIDLPLYHWDVTIAGKLITIEVTDAQVQNPLEFKRRVSGRSLCSGVGRRATRKA